MKIYKVGKNLLKWKEMPQFTYNWKYPIIIDSEKNVILGNSLKDSFDQFVYVIICDINETVANGLNEIETKIAEENSYNRYLEIEYDVKEFFKTIRKPKVEQVTLFDYVDTTCITEDNYRKPPEDSYRGHGRKYEEDEDLEQILEEFDIDLDIMKELL